MSVRVAIAAIFVALAVACDSNVDKASRDNPATTRVEKCAQRILQRVKGAVTAEIERYANTAYCKPFERRGWVHHDGTLSIDAYRLSGTCASSKGGPLKTVPCEELDQGPGPRILDCGLLHLVSKSEVRKYIAALQKSHVVRCDDDTPLASLGAS